MTAANWVTLSIPIIGLFVGAVLYVLQKSLDRRNEVLKERRELYRRSAVMLERLHQALRKMEPDREIAVERMAELEVIVSEIQVTAPDPVAEAWLAISGPAERMISLQNSSTHVELQEFSPAVDEFLRARVLALKVMRDDSYPRTKITFGRILEAMGEVLTATSMAESALVDMMGSLISDKGGRT